MNELTEKEFTHEGWCDTQNKISNVCNCIIGYPLEVIQDQQSKVDKLKAINEQLVRQCDALNKLREENDELVKALEKICSFKSQNYVLVEDGKVKSLFAIAHEALEKHKK